MESSEPWGDDSVAGAQQSSKMSDGLDGDVVDRASPAQHHWETPLGIEQEAGAGSRTLLEEALDKEFYICF